MTRIRPLDIDLSKIDADVLARAKLTSRQREIYEARFLIDPPRSLRALAADLGISAERVRQVETAMLKKLSVALASFT